MILKRKLATSKLSEVLYDTTVKASITNSDNDSESESTSVGDKGAGGRWGRTSRGDPYVLMHPVQEVSAWSQQILFAYYYKYAFSVSVAVEVEPSLCAVRLQKNLFQLMFTRVLNMTLKWVERSDAKYTYQMLVRLSTLETFIDRNEENAKYANLASDEDLDGGGSDVTSPGISKVKFLNRRYLVVEVLHGSTTGESESATRTHPRHIDSSLVDHEYNQGNEHSMFTSSILKSPLGSQYET